MKLAVQCEWVDAGQISLSSGDLVMPTMSDEPGVYQWVLRHDGRDRRYVGETARLRRRFAQYRRPGGSQITNIRMHERAVRVLEAGGTIELLLADNVMFVRDGITLPADLSSKHVRCLVENAALVDVLATIGELVNDKGYGILRDDPILR